MTTNGNDANPPHPKIAEDAEDAELLPALDDLEQWEQALHQRANDKQKGELSLKTKAPKKPR